MRIIAINNVPYFTQNRYNAPVNPAKYLASTTQNQMPDMFIKSPEVTFCANTSAGNPLKRLRNISCPYYGTKMLSGALIHRVEQRLDQAPTIGEAVEVLSHYTEYMQKIERAMYEKFKNYSKEFPQKTLPQYLQELYNDSLTKLKLEEFFVLDDVDYLSRGLTPETAFALRGKITRCRTVILENNQEDTFKRKTLLTSLDEIKLKPEEKELFEKIKDKALYLPTSGSSENAFVVKYANRSHQEIAKRILRASVATIEHIKPDSMGGENKLSNFILASSSANSYRSNMPLDKYIEMFPDIPANCQKYINEIITCINRGALRGNETYPYEVRKTLKKESKGKIILDLSRYKYTEGKAIRKVTRYLEHRHKKRTND